MRVTNRVPSGPRDRWISGKQIRSQVLAQWHVEIYMNVQKHMVTLVIFLIALWSQIGVWSSHNLCRLSLRKKDALLTFWWIFIPLYSIVFSANNLGRLLDNRPELWRYSWGNKVQKISRRRQFTSFNLYYEGYWNEREVQITYPEDQREGKTWYDSKFILNI